MPEQPDPNSDFQGFVAIVIDRLNRIENGIESDRINASDSRRRLHEKIDGQEKTLWGLDNRLEVMERAVTTTNPVFTEYMAYKQRVIGAGMLGRLLWWIGGLVLAAAASGAAVYTYLANHFSVPK